MDSTIAVAQTDTADAASTADLKLEAIVIPVADVDRSKTF